MLHYAADRIFLRKVGGGYIFIHRMLMEYFAALEAEPRAVKASDRYHDTMYNASGILPCAIDRCKLPRKFGERECLT